MAEGALEDVTTFQTVAKGVQFSYSGAIEFSGTFGSVNCAVHTTFKTKLADEFEVTKFELTTATCKGAGGLAGCKVKADNPTLPWPVGRYTPTELEFHTFADIEFETCLMTFLKTEGTLIKGKPTYGAKGGITALTLSGEGTGSSNFGAVKVKVSGALSMGEENSDTYLIEELP